ITLNKKGVKKVNYEFNSNIKINLYYNKEYKKTSKFKKGKSYSHTLNPDISLELFKNDDLFGILHFDSKYKMTESGQFKTEDLNKMHAYKDAIIGSYGSYILGPLEDDINIFTSEEQSNGKRFPSVGAISFQINNCAKGLNNFWNLVEEFIDMADNSD
ncbi:MAG: nuclease domain-containing protein, partial [Nanoarchaeota archaeon]